MSYKLSDEDKKIYSDCYGVNVKQKDDKFEYSGSAEQITKVSGMVNKNKFLSENSHKIGSYKSKPGSMSSHLVDYNNYNNNTDYTEYQDGAVFSFS